MERITAAWQAFTAWFGTGSSSVRITLATLALILGCSCCSLGYAVGSASGNTTANRAAANSTTVTQPTATLAPPTATPKPKAWHTVKHYSGNNNQQTETFHITSDTWRIVWKDTVTGDVGGDFSIDLYTSDNSPVDLVANASGSASQTYNAHASPGGYYMKISALFVNYDVQVQEYS